MKLLRVCVIGAGASGLCVARYLTSQPDTFDTTVFEQTSAVGGTWVYNDNTGTDECGLPVHSSMYANLRTNLPKEVMAFPDFPFPPAWNSFMSHQQVLTYLQDYASHFNLHKYIHFKSTITSVHPLTSVHSDKVVWEVVVENLKSRESQVLKFDAVIVCNGHYYVPLVPELPGLESFPGLVMHSHDYRHPEVFQGKQVVVLGAAASGMDISIQVATNANMVYLSHSKEPLPSKLPENVEQHTAISTVATDGMVTFEDGQQKKVDAILVCTGYKYSFPFLSQDCNIQVKNKRVTHLYKHIFNTHYPSMSFIGLCFNISPFPLFSLQARYIMSVLKGTRSLPSEEEMNADEDRDFKGKISSGLHERDAHHLGGRQWEYNRLLAQLAGCDELSEVYETLYEHVNVRRKYFVMDYKKDEFRLTSEGTWIEQE